jgi:hypothetical protein
MRVGLFIILIAGLAGCSGNADRNPQSYLVVVPRGATLLDTSGEKGRIIQTLAAGTRVSDLGQVSRFTTPIQFGDAVMEAPWLKVSVSDGKTGWVFAGNLQPEHGDAEPWLAHQKERSFFGESLTHQIDQWNAGRDHTSQQVELLDHYHKGMALRTNLINALSRRAEASGSEAQPDFSWLSNMMPGFIYQRVGQGGAPYLFADYRYWQGRAAATPGVADDAFFAIYLAIFPLDSIESFYPVWTIQTGEDSGSSQLGTGKHLQIMKRIDPVFSHRDSIYVPVFPEIKALRDEVLADMLENKRTYWQPADKIKAEIRQIIEANLASLAETDKIALKKRIDMFDDPVRYEIRVNLRSGL